MLHLSRPHSPDPAQLAKFLAASLYIYIFVYSFEGVVRWLLNMVHGDSLIFVRDVLIDLPLLGILIHQALRRSIHPAFLVYFFVIALHGAVMYVNLHALVAVVYGAKLFTSMLAGAIGWRAIVRPGPRALKLFFFLWVATIIGVTLDKWVMELPWSALGETEIGGIKVDVTRNWQILGPDKRAAGFTRSSINSAGLEVLLSFVLFVHVPRLWQKVLIIVPTLATVYFTTSKGAIFAYVLIMAACLPFLRYPVRPLRLAMYAFLVMMIMLPLTLPHYLMPPPQPGVFSFASFYDRIEDMWPRAWVWIDNHEAFPFGVGLGGISGAQRFYAAAENDDADNLYVYMYAYFGLMTYVYLGWVVFKTLQISGKTQDRAITCAMLVMTFAFGYGCVVGLLEDQMVGVFAGASLVALAHAVREQRRNREEPSAIERAESYSPTDGLQPLLSSLPSMNAAI